MRAWDAFTGLDSMVKNMVTSLHAVGELQNPAIRDRHWQQLMNATQVITHSIWYVECRCLRLNTYSLLCCHTLLCSTMNDAVVLSVSACDDIG